MYLIRFIRERGKAVKRWESESDFAGFFFRGAEGGVYTTLIRHGCSVVVTARFRFKSALEMSDKSVHGSLEERAR